VNKTTRYITIFLAAFVLGLGLGLMVKQYVLARYPVSHATSEVQSLGRIVGPPAPTPAAEAEKLLPLRDAASQDTQSGPSITTTFSLDLPQSKVNAWILMYHYIGTPPDPAVDPIGYNLTIKPETLESQIMLLTNLGYQPITMHDADAGKGTANSIVLTFDDGYEDFYTNAWPILKQHNWVATIYVITGKVGKPGYMTWDQIRELHDNGIEIGAHTVNHIDLATATPERQSQEITQSKASLERVLGSSVTSFAYPSGRYVLLTLLLFQSTGFTSAVTTHPGKASSSYNAYELPRLRISPQLTLVQLEKEVKPIKSGI